MLRYSLFPVFRYVFSIFLSKEHPITEGVTLRPLFQFFSGVSLEEGGSLVWRKELENRREVIVEQLKDLGSQCRPIAAGNFY